MAKKSECTIHISMSRDMLIELTKAAEKDHRPVTNLVYKIISDWLTQNKKGNQNGRNLPK